MRGDCLLFLLPWLLALLTSTVSAQEPSDAILDDVTRSALAGHVDQALEVMTQVLLDHPQSGRAHFIEAELLLQQGRISQARAQFADAERIDPSLPFASIAATQRLRTALSFSNEVAGDVSGQDEDSLVWRVLLAISSGAVAAWFLMRPVHDQ